MWWGQKTLWSTFICLSISFTHQSEADIRAPTGSLTVLWFVLMCVFIAGSVRTVWGKPCASGYRTPFQGRCLRLPYRQLLEARLLQEKRKCKSQGFIRLCELKYKIKSIKYHEMYFCVIWPCVSFRIKAYRKNVLAKCVSKHFFSCFFTQTEA